MNGSIRKFNFLTGQLNKDSNNKICMNVVVSVMLA